LTGGIAVPPINSKSYTEEEKQFLKNIGFKIQFLRKQRGISQNELAEKADLSYTTISHIESTSPYGMSIIAIYKIAKALDVDPSQLLQFK
jgi:transcriptional regulator with XRE-family HTH domain